MASPVADAYVAPSGAAVYCGRYPSSALALTLTGPSSGLEKSLSPQVFEVAASGLLTSTITVTPSDGAGGQFWPLAYAAGAVIQISPSNPTCKFWYAPGAAGAKSVVLANDGGLTNPDAHAYTATAASGSATPFRLVRGGTTIGSYATLQGCKDAPWVSGDVVKLTGGTYTPYAISDPGQTSLTDNVGGVQMGVNVATLTIEAEDPGVPMVIDYSRSFQAGMWSGGQPQALTMGAACRSLTLRDLRMRGARPPLYVSWFGAAIWTKLSGTQDGATLTVERCGISEFPDGVKTQDARYDLSVYVRASVFIDNSDNRGLDHDIYTGSNALTDVRGCLFRKTPTNPYPQDGMGHFVKSRCRQTQVHGNFFDGYMTAGGYAGVGQTINPANGGVVSITGNTILFYGSPTSSSGGNPVRYGESQHYENVDKNNDPSLTTHSILVAQNTIRHALGYTPDGVYRRPVHIFPAGVATTLLDGTGAAASVTATVRNNIIAAHPTTLATFGTDYPTNTQVALADIADSGVVTGSPFSGSAADAAWQFAGEYLNAISRSDTFRGALPFHSEISGSATLGSLSASGGMAGGTMPAWYPATAWEWTDVTGTIWNDYVKGDGTGVAPVVTATDPGPDKNYLSQWPFGGPAYSKARHEFWMFGGGHAQTTINAVSRYVLDSDTPFVDMPCVPSTESLRRTEALTPNYSTYAASAYWSDGKPHSPHSYLSNIYVDALDEFLCFGQSACAGSSDGGATLQGDSTGGSGILTLSRAGVWQSAGYHTAFPSDVIAYQGNRYLRSMSEDGLKIYYWVGNGFSPRTGLNVYDLVAKTHTHIGGANYDDAYRVTEAHSGKVLLCDNTQTSGWVGRFINLTTGAATAITFNVIGSALPSAAGMFDLMWIPDQGYYLAVWLTGPWAAWPNNAGSITGVYVSKITPTGSNTADVETLTIAAGDGAPTRGGALRGAYYDPTYECVMCCFGPYTPIKAIKVI